MNNRIVLINNRIEEREASRRMVPDNIDFSRFNNCFILPGFTDVHVHLREPGFLYKETVATGTAAAAAGGFVNIMAMPNVNPAPDCMENLRVQTEAIRKDALVNVFPIGCITAGRSGSKLSEMEQMAEAVLAFSDDGDGVMSDELMLEAMRHAKALNRIIAAHCEDTRYPRESSEAEYMQLDRDLDLAAKSGCAYHVCHISTKESVKLIRDAKSSGMDVTCETAPHYLLLSKENIYDDGRFKMNPPIKQEEDRQALLEALTDGTVDMIATDHAPHSREEKAGGFAGSMYGITGLETAFPVLYTGLVRAGLIGLEKLVELMSTAPCRRFGIEEREDSFSIWNLEEKYTIEPERFASKGKSSPFEGWETFGRCMLTAVRGKVVYEYE